MKMKNRCLVCMDLCKEFIRCINKDCLNLICKDCMKEYLIFCKKEINLLPKCFNKNCNSEFLYKNLKNTEYINIYYDILYNYLKKDRKFEDILNELKLRDKFRKERIEFLNKKIPISINKIINICLKDKLKKIDRDNKYIFEKINKKIDKKCINLYCNNGILYFNINNHYQCNLCDTIFCEKCEKRIDDKHICKEEEIKSIELVNSFIKCPKCKLPIEKSKGCSEMTCANCKTNFDYNTGNQIIYGNTHNKDIKLIENYIPSIILKDKYPQNILDLFILIESKKPKIFDYNQITEILIKIIDNETINNNLTDNLLKKLSIVYYKYKKILLKQKIYLDTLIEIEKLDNENNINKNILINLAENL